MAVLAVIDTGPGIVPEQAAYVFELFYRGTPPGSATRSPRRVSGLG
jgi:signal transduction histidine kinase